MKMEEMISQLLHKIGLRGTLRGFHYLSKAILLVLEDASYLLHLTKRLYPDVALACNATAMRVERSMRTAIEAIWNQGDVAALEELIGYTIKGKPCVGQFIDILAGYLRSMI